MTNKMTFYKMSTSWSWPPPSLKPYMMTFPPATLEQSLRAMWDAVSQAAVLIFPKLSLIYKSQVVPLFSQQL